MYKLWFIFSRNFYFYQILDSDMYELELVLEAPNHFVNKNRNGVLQDKGKKSDKWMIWFK